METTNQVAKLCLVQFGLWINRDSEKAKTF